MKKDNILGIIIMTFGLLLIVSVFLPYANQFSVTSSLWNILSSSRLIYIFLGIFVIVVYLFNKKTELAYLAAGYGFFISISIIIEKGGFSGLSVGFYLILISSIIIGVLTLMYNEKKADALIGSIEEETESNDN